MYNKIFCFIFFTASKIIRFRVRNWRAASHPAQGEFETHATRPDPHPMVSSRRAHPGRNPFSRTSNKAASVSVVARRWVSFVAGTSAQQHFISRAFRVITRNRRTHGLRLFRKVYFLPFPVVHTVLQPIVRFRKHRPSAHAVQPFRDNTYESVELHEQLKTPVCTRTYAPGLISGRLVSIWW